MSKLRKKTSKLSFIPGQREIFDINVVENLPDFSSVFGVIGMHNEIFLSLVVLLHLKNLQSCFSVLEADKSVALGCVLFVHAHFG
jgi:hypothetical protein